jgi:hypothetical protein
MPCGAGVCAHHAGLAGREANWAASTQSLGSSAAGTVIGHSPVGSYAIALTLLISEQRKMCAAHAFNAAVCRGVWGAGRRGSERPVEMTGNS